MVGFLSCSASGWRDWRAPGRGMFDADHASGPLADGLNQTTAVQPWTQRLHRHSLTWVGAFDADTLIGFVHPCWDGGCHAFVLDTCVDPGYQRRGIWRALVQSLADNVATAGCQWLQVDFEPHLTSFYRHARAFPATEAGLLHLNH